MFKLFVVSVSLNVCVLYISCVRGYIYRATCPYPCNCSTHETHHAIDCNDRNLLTIPFFGEYAENLVRAQVDLYLSGNRFEYILKNSFYHLKDRLRSLVIWNNRYKIDLARGAFDKFLDSLELLMIDPLADDIPTAFKMIPQLKMLRELHVSTRAKDKTILSAPLSGPALRKLVLVNCGLYDIADGIFKNVHLETLILNSNHMTEFPKEVTRAISDNVLHLFLANNDFRELKDSDIPLDCKLVTLDLSSNNISSLEEGVLERCRGLKTFNVSNNTELTEVGVNVFDGLSGLVIDISYTRVTKLDFVTPDQVIALHITGLEVSCSGENLITSLVPFRNKLKGTCIDNRGGIPREIDVKNLDINCTRNTVELRRRSRIADGFRDMCNPCGSQCSKSAQISASHSVIKTPFLMSVTELPKTRDAPMLETISNISREATTPSHSLPLTSSINEPSANLVSSTVSLTSSSSSNTQDMISSLKVSALFKMTSTYDTLSPTTASEEAMISDRLTYTPAKEELKPLEIISPGGKDHKRLIPDLLQSITTQRIIIIGTCHSFQFKDLLHRWKNKICDKKPNKLIKYFKDNLEQTTVITLNSNKNNRSKSGDKIITQPKSHLPVLKKEQKRNDDKNFKQQVTRTLRKVIKVKTSSTAHGEGRWVRKWYFNSIISVWACLLHATITFVAFLSLDHGLKTKQRLLPALKNMKDQKIISNLGGKKN